MYYQKKYESTEVLKRDIAKYIRYFNHERISQKTGGLSPVEYRTQAEKQQ